MTLEVRRIVTGHNEFGMGIIVSDEKLSAVSRGLGANISGCEIWSTNSMPVDNSMEAEAAQRAGFVKKYNYVGSGQGTTVRIVEWAPGHAMFWHRTDNRGLFDGAVRRDRCRVRQRTGRNHEAG